jgi:superfamily II DNA or RNA helicase
MPDPIFQLVHPTIDDNASLRRPQREAFDAIRDHYGRADAVGEIGIVLPVGCGKSGAITIAPFATRSRRVLVVAPGVRIAHQLLGDFDATSEKNFYRKTKVLDGTAMPEAAEIRGDGTNRSDLDDADVVITNIQQLQGEGNRWLNDLPADFFDLIINDEAHHNVADSWKLLRERFPDARIVNFSATPLRADGQRMAGQIIYTFPVVDAIREGYVKYLRAVVLNPSTLRFVRRVDGAEVEVPLEEVVRLGEEEADFRRSIVSSKDSLATIVDASITQLRKLRHQTGEGRLKIIASALNYEHCAQVKAAYAERGLKVDFIHTREGGPANARILDKLERHELDVIVQVRMLGEGFDHPYLSVAAVCSVFANLTPFVQFVGRVMRVIKPNAPGDPLNNGVVVFHAGSNVARVWTDFREFSDPDKAYFDQLLLPPEELHFESGADLVEVDPITRQISEIEIRSQEDVTLESIPLLRDDPEAAQAYRLLREKGFTAEQFAEAERVERQPVSKQKAHRANRAKLDETVKAATTKMLAERKLNPQGKGLDPKRPDQSSWLVVKTAFDKEVAATVGRKVGERAAYSATELVDVEAKFADIISRVQRQVFENG